MCYEYAGKNDWNTQRSGKKVKQVEKDNWLLCPVCKSKTRTQIQPKTVLINFPLFCPKCKQKTMVNVHNLKIEIIKEPDA